MRHGQRAARDRGHPGLDDDVGVFVYGPMAHGLLTGTFLEKTLLPRSDGDFRLGAARYKKKFPLALQTDQKPEEVVARLTCSCIW